MSALLRPKAQKWDPKEESFSSEETNHFEPKIIRPTETRITEVLSNNIYSGGT